MWCTSLDSAEKVKNHTAVEAILGDALVMAPVREHWSWKDMDVVWMEEDAQDLYIPRSITSQDTLKDYAQYVMDFITSLSRQHGWLQCLTPRNHSWWSPEIARTISNY